jgi:hypothetical protein
MPLITYGVRKDVSSRRAPKYFDREAGQTLNLGWCSVLYELLPAKQHDDLYLVFFFLQRHEISPGTSPDKSTRTSVTLRLSACGLRLEKGSREII